MFTRLIRRGKAAAGKISGSKDHAGYLIIKIDYKAYKAHRLAWLYVYGAWPIDQIDHINGIKNDNRIKNLREASNRQNSHNKHCIQKNSTTGFTGVSFVKSTNKFRAHISINGKFNSLGVYETAEEAHEVYLKNKRALHGFYAE